MPTPKKILEYCAVSLQKTQAALVDLSQFKEGVVFVEKKQKIKELASELLYNFNADTSIIDPDVILVNKQLIKFLDLNLVDKFLQNTQDENLTEEILFQLDLLYVATGAKPGMNSYKATTLQDIILGKIKEDQIDTSRMLYTLSKVSQGNDLRDLSLPILDILNQHKDRTVYSLDEILLYFLFLDIAWKSVQNIPKDGQILLFSYYFYQSIVLGVPVKEYVSRELYKTSVPFDFFLLCKRWSEYIEENGESIMIKENGSESSSFFELVQKFEGLTGGKGFEDGYVKNNFLQQLYGQEKNRDYLAVWLGEALYIYYHLQQADLIKNNVGGEKTEVDIFFDQQVQLAKFFLEEKDWIKLIAYFKTEKPLVTLNVFLSLLPETFDIENEGAVNMLLRFSALLHENLLLAEDREIIEFHEDEQKFYWSKEVALNK